MRLLGATIGTYRPQYRPLSTIHYLDVNPLTSRYTLFITLLIVEVVSREIQICEVLEASEDFRDGSS
jgi:hypothetical protein